MKRFADMTPEEREEVRAARRAQEAARVAAGREHARTHPKTPEEEAAQARILGPLNDFLNGDAR